MTPNPLYLILVPAWVAFVTYAIAHRKGYAQADRGGKALLAISVTVGILGAIQILLLLIVYLTS